MATKEDQTGKKSSGNRKISMRSIRERAEEIYHRRTEEGTPGDADSDWSQAERELTNH